MNKSESIGALAKALAAAQATMENAKKDRQGQVGQQKTRYADLAGVIEAIKESLAKNGLSYVQLMHPSDRDEVRVETVLMHESGEWVSGVISIPVTRADAQGYGSALTYARRYSLQAITGIASEDDDGNAAAAAAPKAVAKPAESGKSETLVAWDALDRPTKELLEKMADDVREHIRDGNMAVAFTCYEECKATLDATEQVALWSRFDSKERSAIKAQGQLAKAVAA
jgi:predicted nuclease with TOPRIM domain